MVVKFYKFSGEYNEVPKTLVETGTVNNAVPLVDCTLSEPIVQVKKGNFNKANYMYIPDLGRYYFISNVQKGTDGIDRIHGTVDVLMTWKESIKNSNQYVTRQEKEQNRYIVDNNLPIHSDVLVSLKNFGEDVLDKTCDRIVLTTIGNGGAVDG